LGSTVTREKRQAQKEMATAQTKRYTAKGILFYELEMNLLPEDGMCITTLVDI